ncbi:TIGR03084 family protein [Streptomyces sp. ISL-98]|uniref:TIGR03084 family metal-binding protein n=1 Tax=Streptomyces sp. ISL-98 TaxID=2819192 RepID=UPI001BEBF847|nr:TIGR03084 family metal-binding protein [Streptomyces sp. ISL-98]MBT2505376.1 TIGR03084 family protein [Streptomyces sp. ISL-98]
MSDPAAVLDDLRAEGDELDQLVGGLSDKQWSLATPAPRWTVAHQIAHLAWTDTAALLSVTDPEAFAAETDKALAAPERFVDEGAESGAELPVDELLAWWRDGREQLQRALRAAPAGARFPWYGPPMSAASMATGRLMETWAHGQDIADAVGVRREPTARLRHVARIGVRARGYAFFVRGLAVPEEEFRVELVAPSAPMGSPLFERSRELGEGSDGASGGSDGAGVWAYGPEDAPQRVTGPALDFCLLVTQRAHRDDLAVRAEGPDADRWLDIAQAFAGPAGAGRAPRRTRHKEA